MWRVGAGMPAKYGITGDLREALYADADAFIAALHGRPFLGGAEPNLADLSLYGVLCAVRGTDTYNDLVLHSSIGPWLARVAQVVGPSAGTPAEAVAA
jgi:microsomal prostaglandin-E synthase 2